MSSLEVANSGGRGEVETVMEMPFALVLSLELYDDCRFQVFL